MISVLPDLGVSDHPRGSQQRARFGFVTTAYKTERYLSQTINSVLVQTEPDWELVVVDNGPSEEMAEIVRSYQQRDSRISLIRQDNAGYRGGVATAVAASNAEFVCVLDSDDQLEPEFCARVGAALDADPKVDAVAVDAHRFVEPYEDVNLRIGYMRSIGVRRPADPEQALTLTQVLGGRVPYYTAAIRRSAWDEVGGYSPGIDDVDESVIIWCRLVRSHLVRMLPDRLARYRMRADSLSRDPAGVEAFERQLIRSFEVGAGERLSRAERRALQTSLHRLRSQQALRRARLLLAENRCSEARQFAAEALHQQRSLRTLAVWGGMSVSPGMLRRVHPIKGAISQKLQRLTARRIHPNSGSSSMPTGRR